MTNVYVAGPMRGYPQFNFPAFDKAAEYLRGCGFHVCNPAEHDRELHGDDFTPENADAKGFDLRGALAFDLDWIARNAHAVAVLDGWEQSSGARAEVALAHALSIPVAPWSRFSYEQQIPPSFQCVTPTVLTVDPPQGVLIGDTRKDNVSTYERFQARLAGEVRSVSSTGGEKGVKAARYDLLPADALEEDSILYGVGAEKYAPRNWERGYEMSKSFASLNRHLWAFWRGEEIDTETGRPHMASVRFHAAALHRFVRQFPQFDDRPNSVSSND